MYLFSFCHHSSLLILLITNTTYYLMFAPPEDVRLLVFILFLQNVDVYTLKKNIVMSFRVTQSLSSAGKYQVKPQHHAQMCNS